MTTKKHDIAKGIDYLRLRESIKHAGLLEPLVINRARNPEARKLIGGGEARLEILNSLYEETKDPKFLVVDCVSRRSPRPLRRILSHAIQDDVRTRKSFIERAGAVLNCVQSKEQETNSNGFSHLEAVNFLRENGLPISPSTYNQMVYAVEKLLPLLPKALYGGWGRPQIERVRALEKTGSKIWDEFGEFGENFEELFSEVVQSCDSESLHFDDLRYQLEYELYVSCDIELQAVRLLFDVKKSELDAMIRALRQFDTNPTQAKPLTKKHRPPVGKKRERKRPKRTAVPIYNPSIPVDNRITTYAEFNRRRRYARKLALQLATLTGSTRRIKPTDESPIGYSVVGSSESMTGYGHSDVVVSYLEACEKLVCNQESREVRVAPILSEVSDEEWAYLRDLMDVSRTLKKSLRQKPKPISADAEGKDLAEAA